MPENRNGLLETLTKGANVKEGSRGKMTGEVPGGFLLARQTPDAGGPQMLHSLPGAPAAGARPVPACLPGGVESPPEERQSTVPSGHPHQVPGYLTQIYSQATSPSPLDINIRAPAG